MAAVLLLALAAAGGLAADGSPAIRRIDSRKHAHVQQRIEFNREKLPRLARHDRKALKRFSNEVDAMEALERDPACRKGLNTREKSTPDGRPALPAQDRAAALSRLLTAAGA